jgi:ubiquinone/menaquinone biosynthesis C-methylase UbiE
MKVRDLQHDLLPRLTEEDRSRQRAIVALRRTINGKLRNRNLEHYEEEGAPAFAAAHGRQPQSPDEIEQAFFASQRYRMWSALNRASQEMIWLSVGEPAMRDLDRITTRAAELSSATDKKGEVHLDPAHTPSPEVANIDIHLQPGGYAMDRGEGDVLAGVLYETGGNIYTFGQGIGRGDSKAGAVIRHLEESYPDFKPRRILDLGCSAGAASCAYAAHFRQAEVHAGDIGAGMMRYAHARAEALGLRVIFHQLDSSDLSKFADGEFDLVVSHNLFHEIGAEKRALTMKEAARVTRPGGLVIHQDVPTRFEPTLLQQVERAWDTKYNGEAFWSVYANDDLKAEMQAAGFEGARLHELRLSKVDGVGGWYVLVGEKA